MSVRVGDPGLDDRGHVVVDRQEQFVLSAEVVVDAADAGARRAVTTSPIVAALYPRSRNTVVAEFRMRCWVASVLAQRRRRSGISGRASRRPRRSPASSCIDGSGTDRTPPDHAMLP